MGTSKSLWKKGLCVGGFLLAFQTQAAFAAAPPSGPGGGDQPAPQSFIETNTQVSSNLNPSLPGQTVTFTATVSGAVVTGTVAFKKSSADSGSSATGAPPSGAMAYNGTSSAIPGCEAAPVSNGSAQCTTTFDVPGSWDIVAQYSGDAVNTPSAGMLAGGQVVRSEWPLVKVRKVGSGFIIGPGVACGIDCRDYYPPGSTVTLTASPGTHTGFKRWTGCDSVQNNDCTMLVQTDRSVTAEFESASASAGDFNDDGRSDIVWRDNGANIGTSVMWLMNGAGNPVVGTLDTNSGFRVTHTGDFNGDGKSDLVWRHDTSGEVAIALMNGTAVISRANILPPGGGYLIRHVADFNGDGKADLLWQGADGSVVIQLMDGTNLQSGATVLQAGTGWAPVLVGDFDDDGRADILWQSVNDGAAAIWLMNGTTVKSGGSILAAGSGYVAQHLGDFDGDGRADIVWKGSDGSYDLWMMNGLSVIRAGTVRAGGFGYNVVQVADFDGEGRSDLVFEGNDGTTSIWQMDGLTVARTTTFQSPGRTVKQARDYSGDGKADLLWAHNDGAYVLWIMDGGTVVESKSLRASGNTYHVTP